MYCSKCGQELDANNVCNNPACPSNLNPNYNIDDTNSSRYVKNLNIEYKAPYDNSYTNSSTLQYNSNYTNDFSNQYGDDYYGVVPEEFASFVGDKNTEYYIEKWNIYQSNNTFISWNWSAFFFGFFWCAYRKMYNWMIILFAIGNLEVSLITKLFFKNSFKDLLSTATLLPSDLFLFLAIVFAVSIINDILFGLFANQLYIKDCFNKITKVKYAFPSLSTNDLIPRIRSKGGTTWTPIILYFVFFILWRVINSLLSIAIMSNSL